MPFLVANRLRFFVKVDKVTSKGHSVDDNFAIVLMIIPCWIVATTAAVVVVVVMVVVVDTLGLTFLYPSAHKLGKGMMMIIVIFGIVLQFTSFPLKGPIDGTKLGRRTIS
mmetsp:Transcript_42948/g.65986  ORF Transcript_42948/g.65986 Transcript_42948/m.65986 type:complete len:110 (+) Transcript_42948:550-879(+)